VIFEFLQSTLQLLLRYDTSLNASSLSTTTIPGAGASSSSSSSSSSITTTISSVLDSSKALMYRSSDIPHYCHTALQTAAWTISNLARGEIPGTVFVNAGRLITDDDSGDDDDDDDI